MRHDEEISILDLLWIVECNVYEHKMEKIEI